jgi:hypothetical protein
MHFLILFQFLTSLFALIIHIAQQCYFTVQEEITIYPASHIFLFRKRMIGLKWSSKLYFNNVEFFFIHEGIHSNQVEYYLGAKLKNSKKVIVLCPRIHAPLKLLVPIYRELKYHFNISTTLPSFSKSLSY